MGYLFGWFNKLIINKIRLDFIGLYPIMVIGLMFLTFSATDFLHGNGFLAVYLFFLSHGTDCKVIVIRISQMNLVLQLETHQLTPGIFLSQW